MSLSSRESKLAQLREALAQCNSELFLSILERRKVCLKVQEFKEQRGRYSHYDPEREKVVFNQFKDQFGELSMRELLAFSLIMEDQAQAFAPGAYPTWSLRTHLRNSKQDIFEMINPMLLKIVHPEIFEKLQLHPDFDFLKEF